jgi:hypothetical protein
MIQARQLDEWGEEKYIQYLVGKRGGDKQLGRPKRKWKDIRILNKYNLKVWSGFISFMISNNEGKVFM